MNGTAQKNHRTVTQQLGQHIELVANVTGTEIDRLRTAIGEERTHRLKLAEEQRGYVDARDRELRQCCQERWDAQSDTNVRVFKALSELRAVRYRGFWSRLNWLLTGR